MAKPICWQACSICDKGDGVGTGSKGKFLSSLSRLVNETHSSRASKAKSTSFPDSLGYSVVCTPSCWVPGLYMIMYTTSGFSRAPSPATAASTYLSSCCCIRLPMNRGCCCCLLAVYRLAGILVVGETSTFHAGDGLPPDRWGTNAFTDAIQESIDINPMATVVAVLILAIFLSF